MPDELSDTDLLELGRQVDEDPTLDGFSRAGRVVTNLEMYASMRYRSDQRRKAQQFLSEEL